MKYIELEIKLKPENVEGLLNELSIVGINDAVINNPVEIAEIVSNLGDTEWYDAEQVAEDFIASDAFCESHNCNAEGSLCANDAPTFATVTLYCTDDEDGRELAKLVKNIVACDGGASQGGKSQLGDVAGLTVTLRDDSEWKDAWKEYYHTAQVSEKFVVKPTWEDAHVDDGLFVIEIDPGMAFGTGTHETTSLSLRLMEKYVKPGDKVLDVGTGSGILAIAAAKLGASEVLGIDIDEDAVRVANENINNNLASGTVLDLKNLATGTVPNEKTDDSRLDKSRVRAVVGDLTEGIDFTADVVVANLLADLVMKLTSSVAKHMADDAIYITSGILVEKQKQVAECLTENNFTIVEILEDGEWCAIAAKK